MIQLFWVWKFFDKDIRIESQSTKRSSRAKRCNKIFDCSIRVYWYWAVGTATINLGGARPAIPLAAHEAIAICCILNFNGHVHVIQILMRMTRFPVSFPLLLPARIFPVPRTVRFLKLLSYLFHQFQESYGFVFPSNSHPTTPMALKLIVACLLILGILKAGI